MWEQSQPTEQDCMLALGAALLRVPSSGMSVPDTSLSCWLQPFLDPPVPSPVLTGHLQTLLCESLFRTITRLSVGHLPFSH